MCGGSPDVPTVPERQAARMPDGGNLDQRSSDQRRRRFAYAASVLTSPQGVLGQPSTTATTMGQSKLGG